MIQTNENFRKIFVVAVGGETAGGHADEAVLEQSGVEEDKGSSGVAVTFIVAATVVAAGTQGVWQKLVRQIIPDDALGGITVIGQCGVAVTKKKKKRN